VTQSPNLESTDITDDIAALRVLLEGTSHRTGEEFLQSLVRNLATAIGTKYAFVAEFAEVNTRVRTLAFWHGDRIGANIEFDLAGTPCEVVLNGKLCHYPHAVRTSFPDDPIAINLALEGYLGVPLLDAQGATLGHLAVFDDRPMPVEAKQLYTFRIFAARAAAELARLRAEKLLRASEQRFRDLYQEAPVAYVIEDADSRLVSANRCAMKILGLTPDEVPATRIQSLIPDSPNAQRRLKEALASVGHPLEAEGTILEMRRHDDGRPIWVQWWSRPEPASDRRRTIFIDITDRVLAQQKHSRLEQQNAYLLEEIKSEHNFEEIIGRSPPLLRVLDNVRLVAPTEASVLITGETGSGKELIARAIHSASLRRDEPLIKVNCAALPAGLVESELFGHEKGAFTGALQKRLGRFELADRGTIFLDEIGDLPLDAQVKLLRVLQEREFERVGGVRAITVDVRIIAATNRDLHNAVRDKTFREDLYYRLNVFPIALPALRERSEDIPLLAQFLVEKLAPRIGKRIDGIHPESLELLQAYSWPGNVRELENVLERAVILSPDPVLEIDPLLLAEDPSPAPVAATPGADDASPKLEDVERKYIRAVLEQTGGIIEGTQGAAAILGLNPSTLRSRLKKLGISR
jgi:PAS domain S-box-containing protein